MSFFKKDRDKLFSCNVLLLNNEEQCHQVTRETLGSDVLIKVSEEAALIEKEYFGLMYLGHNSQLFWLDDDKSIKKQLGGHPFKLIFRVKYYPAKPATLLDERTRYLFFLQIKKDILEGRIPLPINNNIKAALCASAIQSDYGDSTFSQSDCRESDVSQSESEDSTESDNQLMDACFFVPNITTELQLLIREEHLKLKGMTPSKAERSFLEHAQSLDMYGYQLHPVKMKENDSECQVGVSSTGISVFRNWKRFHSFLWSKIANMKCNGDCLVLLATDADGCYEEKKYIFVCSSEGYAANLLKFCVDSRTFYLETQQRIEEVYSKLLDPATVS